MTAEEALRMVFSKAWDSCYEAEGGGEEDAVQQEEAFKRFVKEKHGEIVAAMRAIRADDKDTWLPLAGLVQDWVFRDMIRDAAEQALAEAIEAGKLRSTQEVRPDGTLLVVFYGRNPKGGEVTMSTERPRRYQRSRRRGARLPPGTVCVDRSTKWGNEVSRPVAKTYEAHAACVEEYRAKLMAPAGDAKREEARRELRGRNLACYCPLDLPCHADVLLAIANGEESP
jgi:hypothetical protein